MNNSSRQTAPKVEQVVEEKTATPASWMAGTTITAIAIIPAIFALVFHLGAAYMSYQRNQSVGWAIVSFFLAIFYYPYYAFTQAGKPAETPAATETPLMPAVQSAGRRLKKLLTGKRK